MAKIEGRPAVIVANDATVKAGAWWPETITKILRAQEIAMRNAIPIVYLVDSAGVNLPLQDGIFPGQYGAARIFYYNSLMRRRLHIPQIAAVMGPCIAGGAYLPALSDIIIMVEKVSFMGLGGPNLVKGAVGQVTDSETLGGAAMHTAISGVAHYKAADDAACLQMIRQQFRQMPAPRRDRDGSSLRSQIRLASMMCCRRIIGCLTKWKTCSTGFWMGQSGLSFSRIMRRSFCARRDLEWAAHCGDCESARLFENEDRAADWRHCVYGIGAQSRLFCRECATA